MKPLLLLAISLSFLAGCGSNSGRPPVVAAKGKVTYKGQPAAGALIVFHCLEKGRENDPKPVATAKDDGTFALTTYDEGDGAPAGEYGVTVVWNEKGKGAKMSLSGEGGGSNDKLGGRYGDPKNTKLKATVTKGQPNDFTFDVQ